MVVIEDDGDGMVIDDVDDDDVEDVDDEPEESKSEEEMIWNYQYT